ncbi:MAG: UDP-N-acetylglucosamine 1-carboxyvinyltransferase [Oscillospiraceae bacterium]|nr:UDP-N-acetylglucosamine 1-carboxyvinyltransferase [Oscillospiraceae bacterium]
MEKFIIAGGQQLDGKLKVHGAKNAALPILAASLVAGHSTIHNCPNLTDVDAACRILTHLGAKALRHGDAVTVEPEGEGICYIPEELMHRMRSSIVFLGAVIARCGRARISMPGGCELGPRPIDLHLAALERLGVEITEDHGFLDCQVHGRLHGAQISLPFPSVGATENVLIAASLAQGETILKNAAREPEIVDLIEFLNEAGAKINLTPQGDLHIKGVKYLGEVEHRVIPDRIAAATYLCAVAAAGGKIELEDVCSEHLSAVLPYFEEMGCRLTIKPDSIQMAREGTLHPLEQVRTMPYPGFPTDAQSPLMAAACVAEGTSIFIENIFESRYKHVPELCRMGADIKAEGRVAVVRGVPALHSAKVFCTDLRGGAAIAVGALAAEGNTELLSIEHIDRGYENFEGNLQALGARIKRVPCPDSIHY